MTDPSAVNTGKENLDELRRENLGRLLIRTFNMFERDVREEFELCGLGEIKKTHFPVLRNLDVDGDQISDIAQKSGLSKQTVGPLVRELKELGIVRVGSDPADGRAKRVTWTEEGLRGLLIGMEIVDHVTSRYEKVIGEHRMLELRSALADLLAAFEKAESIK